MTKLINFFRDSNNEHLATWIQTISVVAGVIIALFQFSSVLQESDYKKGEKFLKFENEYSSQIGGSMGLIHEYYTNRGSLQEEKYNELYPVEKLLKAKNSVEDFVSRVSNCGAFKVCPTDIVDNVVCSISQRMHIQLSKSITWPSEWKITFSEPVFYEMKINEHCGLFERITFWYLR
jgi:hypothetical protein